MERETKHMLPHFEKEKSIVYVNYFTCSFMKNSFNYSEFKNKKKYCTNNYSFGSMAGLVLSTTSGNKGCSTLSMIHMNPSTSRCLIALTIVAVIGACMSFLFGMRLHA
jgi:hypothetical protein